MMPSKSGREDDEGMDVDKDGVLGDDSPLIVKNTTRVADEREVDEFVKTFKHYGLTAVGSHTGTTHANPNGVNGVSTYSTRAVSSPTLTKANEVTATLPTKRKGKPAVEAPQMRVDPPSTWTSPASVEKKRKKSSG